MSDTFDFLDRALYLLRKYRENCHCLGDQYGSYGPCEECQKSFEFLKEVEGHLDGNA